MLLSISALIKLDTNTSTLTMVGLMLNETKTVISKFTNKSSQMEFVISQTTSILKDLKLGSTQMLVILHAVARLAH